MKHALAACCLLLLVGCQPPQAAPSASPDGLLQPPRNPAPAATTAPASAALMATVNGAPIYLDELVNQLIEAYGVQTSEIMIANVLVAQEAARETVTVSDADVQAENDRSVAAFLPDNVSPDSRQRVLDELLRRRGITYPLWKQIMRRNALLRKMAQPRVVLNDVMVQTEFARLYGPKVQVRHIQLPGIQEAQGIVNLLREGGDFADLARQNSINAVSAAQGGLLPPFSVQDELVAKPIRDAAFALNQPGELSGIVQVGGDCHVLRLEKKLPAEKVDFEQVKDKVRTGLQDRLTEQLQARILTELRRKADVEYSNPILRKAAVKPLQ